jgi:hypothetical protein
MLRDDIAPDERQVDCWKNEIITFVFKVKAKVRSRPLSVSSILYFKLIWIDEMPIITES